MIYTVTFNPALDYVMRVKSFRLSAMNRTYDEGLTTGGKGLNVSVVLRNLGVDSRALGFVAGFTGDEILRRLHELGIATDMVYADGMCRINVKLKSEEETEINARGVTVTSAMLESLMEKATGIPDGSTIVLAGSVPESLPSDVYERILARLEGKHVRAVVDATGELLVRTLVYRPYLVKPNHHELGDIFGIRLHSRAEISHYAHELHDRGARNVICSMAGAGALMVTESGEEYFTEPPRGKVVDSVGAGDSLVAGFLAAKEHGASDYEAFLQGVAAGSASAFKVGLATREEIETLRAAMTGE